MIDPCLQEAFRHLNAGLGGGHSCIQFAAGFLKVLERRIFFAMMCSTQAEGGDDG